MQNASPSVIPHKKKVIALLLASWAVFAIIELTGAGRWIFETGAIHLFAITYAIIAFSVLFSQHLISDGNFRTFARLAAMAMAALGIAHVVEYFGDTRGLYSEETVAVVVSGAYLIAFLLIIHGVNGLMRQAGASVARANGAITALVLAHIILSSSFYTGHALSHEDIGILLGVILLVAVVFCVAMLGRLGRKMAVLQRFVRYIQVAVVLVLASYSFEVFSEFLASLGLSEGQRENYAHYLFYTGLTIFALSFDLLRHLGGIYADIQKEMEKPGAPAT